MSARLTSWLWIAALRQHVEAAGRAVYIVSRGEESAGSVILLDDRCDGTARLWVREYDYERDQRLWRVVEDGPYAGVRAAALRQKGFDPDLWVVEAEGADLDVILQLLE